MAFAFRTIALVSGGNTGIGFEIIKKLMTENPSYHILMGARNPSKAESAIHSLNHPSNVSPIPLDVTSDASIEACRQTIEEDYGHLDLLINNAGVAGAELPPSATMREKFQHCFDVNVFSAAVLSDAMVPLLKKAEHPRILFISSGLGSISWMADPEHSTFEDYEWYSCSKGAMNWIAAFYGRKYRKDGFRVHAVCPGFASTGLNSYAAGAPSPSVGAIRACELATQVEGELITTFSNKEGSIPW